MLFRSEYGADVFIYSLVKTCLVCTSFLEAVPRARRKRIKVKHLSSLPWQRTRRRSGISDVQQVDHIGYVGVRTVLDCPVLERDLADVVVGQGEVYTMPTAPPRRPLYCSGRNSLLLTS